MLYASSSEPISFCTPRGPLVTLPMLLRAAPKILAPGPLGCPPTKTFSPNFPKILGMGSKFSSALYGDPQGPPGIKFWWLYLGPLPRKKFRNFAENRRFLELHKNSNSKKVESMRTGPPSNWAKVHSNRFSFWDFSSKKTNFELAAIH